MTQLLSWGRYPKVENQTILPLQFRCEDAPLTTAKVSLLPYGLGRSYGDSCLNDGGALLHTCGLRRFIAFDRNSGVLRCEAGVAFPEIYRLIVPHGWFLPVTPGTRFLTLGGAIANDIHGKNHHRSGTFGCHVRCFELLRSDGQRLVCSPQENTELFRATVGGLGLTGLITWAEIQLKPINSPFINAVTIKFSNLDEFFQLNETINRDYEYTVAWVDCVSRGRKMGRGHFIVGNSAPAGLTHRMREPREHLFDAPCNAPGWVLNKATIHLFNLLYYHRQQARQVEHTVHYEPFFHPLDAIGKWNRIYGRRGFFQYQFVVPCDGNFDCIYRVFEMISDSGMGSFLAVMKTFGDIESPGLLSFPRAGFTLALDFPNLGAPVQSLFTSLDTIIRDNGGRIYPAKDARMSGEMFRESYPAWEDLSRHIDPQFSSSFWRRVTEPDRKQD